mmetsp:Transcript_53130/g.123691  ORF Transcript_53130/g.123691 Transcript_53130/m.123691 type:complete len:214 (-) Transcript_53130:317-958(-)
MSSVPTLMMRSRRSRLTPTSARGLLRPSCTTGTRSSTVQKPTAWTTSHGALQRSCNMFPRSTAMPAASLSAMRPSGLTPLRSRGVTRVSGSLTSGSLARGSRWAALERWARSAMAPSPRFRRTRSGRSASTTRIRSGTAPISPTREWATNVQWWAWSAKRTPGRRKWSRSPWASRKLALAGRMPTTSREAPSSSLEPCCRTSRGLCVRPPSPR